MNKEELIEVLRQFDERRVEELPEKTRNIFYAIMKIADERDELENIRKEAIEELSYMSTDAYVENYDIREKHYNLLMNILNKGDNK